MNATTASATTAPTMNAHADRIVVFRYSKRDTHTEFYDRAKLRTYMRRQARDGFKLNSVCYRDTGGEITMYVHIRRVDWIKTPGEQTTNYGRMWDPVMGDGPRIMSVSKRQGGSWVESKCVLVPTAPTIDHYRIRTVRQGVIVEGTNQPTELDARTTAQNIVDADPTGETEAWIIPVMSDRTLGGVLDVIRYEPPTENTDWMFPDDDDQDPINAVEECANICPTARDAVNIASILDTPIRIITPTHVIEVNWTVCRVEIRRNSRYVRGFIELEDVSFDMDKDGLRISYYEKGINHFDDWFIAWGDIQTITALTSKMDIFKSVKGAN